MIWKFVKTVVQTKRELDAFEKVLSGTDMPKPIIKPTIVTIAETLRDALGWYIGRYHKKLERTIAEKIDEAHRVKEERKLFRQCADSILNGEYGYEPLINKIVEDSKLIAKVAR